MTRGLTFGEAFWDSDIVGTYGWEALSKRMKDGKKVCADIVHYFKDRAKAELDYSKAILNLTRRADGKEETGILGDGWREMKRQSELIGQVHEMAGTSFNLLHQELAQFTEEQTKQKKQHEDGVKRSNQNKANEYQKVQNLKKSYDMKCREYDVAKESFYTSRTNVTTKRNEVEKAKQKNDKCLDAMSNADLAYKSSIESLDAARINWERQMEATCKDLEVLEIARMECLRDKIWRCTNIESTACVSHDDCCDRVRDTLEPCDVMADLQSFIEKHRSGSQRPDRVEYEQYHRHRHGSGPMERQSSRKGPTVRPHDLRPPPIPPQPRPQLRTPIFDEGPYASVDDISSPAKNTSPWGTYRARRWQQYN